MSWMDSLRDRLTAAAEKRSLQRRQFAATLVMLIIVDGLSLAVQVGDSAIVGRRDGTWEPVCWPENGEFASTTFFVTDDPQPRLNIVRPAPDFDAFALFSDGIESLALEHATAQPHAAFFNPMMKPIDRSDGSGRLADLSLALGAYLDSPAICGRTDDDKTLILLSCA